MLLFCSGISLQGSLLPNRVIAALYKVNGSSPLKLLVARGGSGPEEGILSGNGLKAWGGLLSGLIRVRCASVWICSFGILRCSANTIKVDDLQLPKWAQTWGCLCARSFLCNVHKQVLMGMGLLNC